MKIYIWTNLRTLPIPIISSGERPLSTPNLCIKLLIKLYQIRESSREWIQIKCENHKNPSDQPESQHKPANKSKSKVKGRSRQGNKVQGMRKTITGCKHSELLNEQQTSVFCKTGCISSSSGLLCVLR